MPSQTGRQRHSILSLSTVHSFICYCSCECERNILETNEPILMPVGTSGPCASGMKWSALWIRRSKVETEDVFGDVAEASFLTPLGLVGVPVTPPPLTSSWPHLRCDVGLEEGEYK